MGVHLYQMTSWESPTKRWYVNDVKNLSGRSSRWYTPMRILDLSIDEYINLLIKFNAQDFFYYKPTNYLHFSFAKERDAKAFCSYVNKVARVKNYCCA